MAIKNIKTARFTWYYLTGFAEEEASFVRKNFKFHPLDLKDCAGEIQRSKIDIYQNYLFLIFQLPQLDHNRVVITQVYFFVGKDFLVSVTPDKIKPLNNFFYKSIKNQRFKDDVLGQGPGYLLYKILDTLLRSSWAIHTALDQRIQRIETAVDTGQGKQAVFDIAALRRIILQLKAIIDPQRITTNTLSRVDANFLRKDIAVYFDDIDDYVEKTWFSLESHKDRILSLQEINESLISYRTNQVMKVLTTFSVALLPLTLLSGIYGMNIDLPLADHPLLVGSMFGLLIIVIIGIFIYLKKQDWI